MAFYTAKTKNGTDYTPTFIESIDETKCIGCGRCFKICSRNVLGIKELDEDDSARMFMSVVNDGNCIGCMACAKACPKNCYKFKPKAV